MSQPDLASALEAHRTASLKLKMGPADSDVDPALIEEEERCWKAVLDANPIGNWQLALYAEYLATEAIEGHDPETRTGHALDCLRYAVLKAVGRALREEAA